MVGVARTRGALGAAVIAALLLVAAAPARAAETVIGFDHFPGGEEAPAGTVAGGQWEAEGVTFGKAEEFGQPSVAGNCGKPTVARETATPAASAPNFAVLATCVAAFNTQGTFGALSAPARGSLSVEVRNLTSTPNVGVSLVGYDGAGVMVAEGHGEATSAGWQRIAATLNGATRDQLLRDRDRKSHLPGNRDRRPGLRSAASVGRDARDPSASLPRRPRRRPRSRSSHPNRTPASRSR